MNTQSDLFGNPRALNMSHRGQLAGGTGTGLGFLNTIASGLAGWSYMPSSASGPGNLLNITPNTTPTVNNIPEAVRTAISEQAFTAAGSSLAGTVIGLIAWLIDRDPAGFISGPGSLGISRSVQDLIAGILYFVGALAFVWSFVATLRSIIAQWGVGLGIAGGWGWAGFAATAVALLLSFFALVALGLAAIFKLIAFIRGFSGTLGGTTTTPGTTFTPIVR